MNRYVLAAASALALVACAASSSSTSRGVPLLVSWDGVETAAAVELTVSAPDLPIPIVVRLAEGGAAIVHVPPGPDRTISAHAVDALGFVSHAGAVTMTIDERQAPAVRIPLRRGLGFAAFTIHVGPPDSLPSANPEVALTR